MDNKIFKIDETTRNDLNLDEIVKRLDICKSSVGKEYLKRALSEMRFDRETLEKRSDISDFFSADKKIKNKVTTIFSGLGITKKVNFRDYIFRISEVKTKSNIKHYILIVLLLAALVMLFIKPIIGIIAIVAMFAINISLYFAEKGKIEGYFLSIKYLCSMVIAAGKLADLELKGTPAFDYQIRLKELYKKFAPIKRGSWLLTNSVSGSLIDVIMDYVRMLFHVDLIKFNNTIKIASENAAEIDEMYCILGEIELSLCIGAFRDSVGIYTKPDLGMQYRGSISFEGIYHPLIKEPVKNSLTNSTGILLTGSNASGKSTFLKSVAINQIFAQTIYTCLAENYKSDYVKVISSMALSDNILNNESYFIVEVKSLKRVFDELGEIPVMVFVDEVLRGTNTSERIAASTVLLKKLSTENAFVFAATHDRELTELLSGYLTNYHFSEIITDTVTFDYKLKDGPSTSRNAIKLLEMYGFDKQLVREAETLAN